ncbi:McrB family protein [Nostoc sp. 'Peltigera malacea cyanobiont' DB3992]|uniref:McrB family protein n=1 Tax=Nostoc sp. 'Peltigera malacea cyanobiont' DB3992 TaxID=1206980 RepID=UPI000C0488CE|nr:AAA family ATPase [Nostoc sp. 'Peltigera malacea cyanobiont' DB3992]PHM08703.1 ATPase [Nostoc sp. 'Peltigera malacea cyanobiont' DB3992]
MSTKKLDSDQQVFISEKNSEFIKLFKEFISSYPYTPNGLRYQKAYHEQRQKGKENFQAIVSAYESGEDISESVLLQLLPYALTPNNIQRNVWTHHTSVIAKDIKEWFENKGWTKSKDWLKIGQAIFNFVFRCNNYPNQLVEACKEFSKLDYSKGFQTGMLTPILNAIRANDFLLINNKSLLVINYFTGKSHSRKITDYPTLNAIGKQLIQELASDMRQTGVPSMRDDDLFDMFCHWLVAVKKYNFAGNKLLPMDKISKLPFDVEAIEMQPEYSLSQCALDTGIEEETLLNWLKAIERKKQAIFYGSPGTGKTYIAKKLAKYLTSGSDGFVDIVQFHPAYTYEDFVQGIRPQRIDGELDYPLVNGRFLDFCYKAFCRQHICVLIIDEINRANVARVFGELMYLLEYRDEKIPLAAGEVFSIPANVRIIGTMNTADRSIALVDHAIRRRFAFIPLYPNYEILRRHHLDSGFPVDKLIQTLKKLNHAIGNPHNEVGISFFLLGDLADQIGSVWQLEIEPYLEEYFFDQPSKVDQFRWNEVKKQIYP